MQQQQWCRVRAIKQRADRNTYPRQMAWNFTIDPSASFALFRCCFEKFFAALMPAESCFLEALFGLSPSSRSRRSCNSLVAAGTSPRMIWPGAMPTLESLMLSTNAMRRTRK